MIGLIKNNNNKRRVIEYGKKENDRIRMITELREEKRRDETMSRSDS